MYKLSTNYFEHQCHYWRAAEISDAERDNCETTHETLHRMTWCRRRTFEDRSGRKRRPHRSSWSSARIVPKIDQTESAFPKALYQRSQCWKTRTHSSRFPLGQEPKFSCNQPNRASVSPGPFSSVTKVLKSNYAQLFDLFLRLPSKGALEQSTKVLLSSPFSLWVLSTRQDRVNSTSIENHGKRCD